MSNLTKIGVIGAGNVGAAIVNALVLRNVGKEIILFNRDKDKAVAETMDIDDTIPLLSEMTIKATNDYKDLAKCSIIAVTVGARQKEGETRLELLDRNAGIIKDIIKNLDKYAPNAVLLMVSNPVDILTRVAQEATKRDSNKVFGSGTVLDTSRLRFQVGKELNVNRKNVHVHVIGEHGDSEFAVWSNAIIGSVKLKNFPLPENIKLAQLKKKTMKIVKNRAYEIIQKKGYTNYGVAVAVVKLIQSVIRDEKKIFSVSVKANEEYNLEKGTVLSLPCTIGNQGVEYRLNVTLNKKEKNLLQKASKSLSDAYKEIKA
ncbi:L-lactate dehydrogenase [Arcobacter sp. CECT 8983]|uniref:L-lactate dehydrogenase n=1 Tax=Arcobacter sp. CECT 8983 TaxID=2044508 RepID=UPI00100BF72C|nr:L-lactate dehydrogenase [Arcobacter sp. CECT 8983]RXJ90541.1 L-lactate dehydrogenase [Arcobacter sp. CECT 8983]